ncbi:hemerythrin domain-containing protein [Streptomyces sp. NPDC090106]|uniref:hemerythrin domain-containing protein n=1 Tax=Streptomyces sp. NPDC090106 TaxID=3365946 RepID=UPI0037F2ABE9
MSVSQLPAGEGALLFEEFLAVHTVVNRGAQLVAGSFTRLAGGAAVDTKVLVTTAQWLVDSVRRHHRSGDELLWPLLRERFPLAVRRLDRLTDDDDTLDEQLVQLADVVARMTEERAVGGSVGWGHAMREGTVASHQILDGLTRQLAAEGTLLEELFAKSPDEDVPGLRKAVAGALPRTGTHLVFGLLEHPEPVPGRERVHAGFPQRVRWSRGLLLNKFRKTLRELAAE